MSLPSPTVAPETAEPQGPEFDFLTWFEVNKKLLSALLTVVIVAVVASMFLRYRKESTEAEANKALIALSGGTNSPSSAAYLEVARAHAGTRAAERANLLAASQLFTEGKFAESRALFDRIVSDFPNSPTVPTALLGVAGCLSAEGKTQDAVAAYQRVITSFPTDANALRARTAKARLHESAGQFEQALGLYDEIIRDPSGGTAMQSAFQARARILQKHPELDKSASTNSVKAAAHAK